MKKSMQVSIAKSGNIPASRHFFLTDANSGLTGLLQSDFFHSEEKLQLV